METFKSVLTVIILFILFSGCKGQTEQQSNETVKAQKTNVDTKQSYNNDHNLWISYLYQKPDSIALIYTEDAVKILPNGKILTGNKQIQNYYFSNSIEIISFQTDTIINANENRKLAYEIGSFKDNKGQHFKQLIIWQTIDNKNLRVFEFTSNVESTTEQSSILDKRRALWMQLCNAHDAKELIEEMYSANTLYYNHKPVIEGRTALVQEYQYMNNPSYKLSLNPIRIEMVRQDLIYEIGQCEGSYNGKYILIWKEEDGKWRIFIDSNI